MSDTVKKSRRQVLLCGLSGHVEGHAGVSSHSEDPHLLFVGKVLYVQDVFPGVMRRLRPRESIMGILVRTEKG